MNNKKLTKSQVSKTSYHINFNKRIYIRKSSKLSAANSDFLIQGNLKLKCDRESTFATRTEAPLCGGTLQRHWMPPPSRRTFPDIATFPEMRMLLSSFWGHIWAGSHHRWKWRTTNGLQNLLNILFVADIHVVPPNIFEICWRSLQNFGSREKPSRDRLCQR